MDSFPAQTAGRLENFLETWFADGSQVSILFLLMYSRLLSLKLNKRMAPCPGSPRVRNAALLSLNFSGETILQF